jgi:hypothetical protein
MVCVQVCITAQAWVLTVKENIISQVSLLGRRWFPVPEYSSLPPVLNNTCSVRKSTAPEKRVASVAACDTDGKEPGNPLDRLFSLEQQASILQVLNTASDKELEAFRLLRGRKSVNIVEHRKKFGPFQRLENLIDVPLIQYKTAVEVCNSILCPENRRRKKSQEKWLLRKFIKPGVEQERLKVQSPLTTTLWELTLESKAPFPVVGERRGFCFISKCVCVCALAHVLSFLSLSLS